MVADRWAWRRNAAAAPVIGAATVPGYSCKTASRQEKSHSSSSGTTSS